MRLQMKRPARNAARGLLLAGLLLAVPAHAQTDYWSTSGSRIVDAQGNTVHITGANWFGFETSNMMPHGLWSVNYRSFLDKVKSMGITVIRLPYSDDIMSNAPVQSLNDYVNPELKGATTLQLMDAIVAYCKQLGIRIILDRHRPTGAGQSALWYIGTVSEAKWIANMQALATRYKGNDAVIGFDLHNEPHAEGTEPNSTGACWGCGDVNRDWRLAAERGGNAVLQANPDLLILVEGVSCPSGGNANIWDNIPDEQCGWWGGNITRARQYPVRLSNPRKLVYSPHDYGMSVYGQQSWFLDPTFPATLEPYWDNMWGYLAKEGIAPILIGEFGSTLQDPKDRVWLPRLLDYANRNGMSWTYWCLNPNSGDTKGLFLDDWTTIDTVRYDVIKPFLTPLKGGGSGPTYYTLSVRKAGDGLGAVSGGGIDCGAACSASLESGTVVTLVAAPELGSTFAGWSGACTGTAACTVTMTTARTVTATFNPIIAENYTLTVTKTGTGSGTVTGPGLSCGATCTVSYPAGTLVQLTAVASPDSRFTGWSGDCAAGSVAMTSNKACIAQFTFVVVDNPVLLVTKSGAGSGTVTSNPAGIQCGASCSATYAPGTLVTLTATPAAGATFGGWSGACTGTASCVVTMSQSREVTAAFVTCCSAYSLTVTKAGTGSGRVTSSPPGIDCGSTCAASYGAGTTVTLTASPSTSATFTGWSGACVGTGLCVVSMTAARTVTATFETACLALPLTVTKTGTGTGTVTSTPAGINCGTTCSVTFACSGPSSVTLTATPASGSRFAGWSGACTGTASTCTAPASGTVTAAFEPVTTTPCANPIDFTHNTNNFNTTGAVCYRTSQRVNGWGCANFAGRTISVNGAATTCGAGPFPLAQSDGYTYFSATAGSYPWASIYIW